MSVSLILLFLGLVGVQSQYEVSPGDAAKGYGMYRDPACLSPDRPTGCIGGRTDGARFCSTKGGTQFPPCPSGPQGARGQPAAASLPRATQAKDANQGCRCKPPTPDTQCVDAAPVCVQRSAPFCACSSAQHPPLLKVAFLGDSGASKPFQRVLNMLRAEGVDALVHAGDLGYGEGKPEKFLQMIEQSLSKDMPMIGCVGNHDVQDWTLAETYSTLFLKARRMGSCQGQVGVKMVCTLPGVTVVSTAPGTLGSGHAEFIRKSFVDFPNPWKVCVFHKLMKLMQTGGKGDEAGWAVYEACRKAGAIIVNGHTHLYSRSLAMSSFRNQVVASTDPELIVLKPGQSMVAVAGTGGMGLNNFDNKLRTNPWWAATARENGALICSFGVAMGQAMCEFVDSDRKVHDRFKMLVEPGHAMAPNGCIC